MAKNKKKRHSVSPKEHRQNTTAHTLRLKESDHTRHLMPYVTPNPWTETQHLQQPFIEAMKQPVSGSRSGEYFRNYLKKRYQQMTEDEQSAKLKIVGNAVLQEITNFCRTYTDTDEHLYRQIEQKDSIPVDTLDFRQYIHTYLSEQKGMRHTKGTCDEMMHAAIDALNERPETKLLWSTREFTDIQLTPYISYRLHRKGYDREDDCMEYLLVEYRKFELSDKKRKTLPDGTHQITPPDVIELPVSWCCFRAGILHLQYDSNEQQFYMQTTNKDPLPLSKETIDEKSMKQVEQMHGIFGRDTFCLPYVDFAGQDPFINAMFYMEDHHTHLSKENYRFLKDCMTLLQMDVLKCDKLYKGMDLQYLRLSVCTALSAVIIANKRLLDKKLSRPVREQHTQVKHETGDVFVPEAVRKTRLLGDNIIITSEDRPQPPDMNKIIHYHTPAWPRNAYSYTRKKDGRLIVVGAHTCHRRCVDMPDMPASEAAGTDYIITAEKGILHGTDK